MHLYYNYCTINRYHIWLSCFFKYFLKNKVWENVWRQLFGIWVYQAQIERVLRIFCSYCWNQCYVYAISVHKTTIINTVVCIYTLPEVRKLEISADVGCGRSGGLRGGSSAKEVLRSSAAGRKKKESVYCVFQYTWYY